MRAHLTASTKEVSDLGYSHIIGHVGPSSGGSAPVDADVLALLERGVQPVLAQHFLKQTT